LPVIAELRLHQVVVGSRSHSEVRREPAVSQMQAAISSQRIGLVTVDLGDATEQGALQQYDARIAFRGRGDAEVLALAKARGYIVGSDDRALRSAALVDCAGGSATAVDILRWAVLEGRLSVRDAVALLQRLDVIDSVRLQVQREGIDVVDLFGS